ncbi:recombinase family protein [Nitratireductor indicus]
MKRIRCAIYTRKSSEDGLEQEFNSLHAQREACAAYIASQKHEGWVQLPGHYDDGGLSGGNMDRPGLQQLLHDIDEGLVDQIVVYKIDRLTRSLTDFAKLVERLDAAQASFVSVTQSFNTSTSMGRLTLNVLLSFAQFEREVTAERIRDKITASKKKGLWMGGAIPLGYTPDGRTLKIVEQEARIVRQLFDLYHEHGSVLEAMRQAERIGLRAKPRFRKRKAKSLGNDDSSHADGASGRSAAETDERGGKLVPFARSQIHYILTNPVYAGRIRHHEKIHAGQHPAIITPEAFDAVQMQLSAEASRTRNRSGSKPNTSLLAGKLRDETGDRLTASHAAKKGRRYRYYVSNRLISGRGQAAESASNGWRLPAKPLEDQLGKVVLAHLRKHVAVDLLQQPSAGEIAGILRILDCDDATETSRQELALILDGIEQARVTPGEMQVVLQADAVAAILNVPADRLNAERLCFATAFQFRKRGVETKLVIAHTEKRAVDQVLIRNIARAHRYYDAVKEGSTIDEIAAREKLSRARIVQLIDLAFLAPDVLQSIIWGEQPVGLTSEWLQRNDLPSDWQAQRRLIAAL